MTAQPLPGCPLPCKPAASLHVHDVLHKSTMYFTSQRKQRPSVGEPDRSWFLKYHVLPARRSPSRTQQTTCREACDVEVTTVTIIKLGRYLRWVGRPLLHLGGMLRGSDQCILCAPPCAAAGASCKRGARRVA